MSGVDQANPFEDVADCAEAYLSAFYGGATAEGKDEALRRLAAKVKTATTTTTDVLWAEQQGEKRLALARENARLREALTLIAEHARLDEKERGFGEASRYYGIAEGALTTTPPAATSGASQDTERGS